jgi:DNA-binding MarR family transcriptional regulator
MPLTDDARCQALDGLRELVLAAEHARRVIADLFGLTLSDMSALSYLHTRGDLGQTDLAGTLGMNTSSVTTLIDRLETGGLVTRNPHFHDRRRTVISITHRGSDFVDQMRAWFGRALDTLPSEQAAIVATSFAQLAAELATQAPPGPLVR